MQHRRCLPFREQTRVGNGKAGYTLRFLTTYF
jgi:hypothetical protein